MLEIVVYTICTKVTPKDVATRLPEEKRNKQRSTARCFSEQESTLIRANMAKFREDRTKLNRVKTFS